MTVSAIETEELNMTEIGLLPREWGLATLGDIFYVQQGKALSPKSRQGISPRPFLRTANVLWGHLNLSTVDKMDFSEEEAARLALKPGDLLVCEGGDIGRTAMWHGELPACYYQNHIHRLRPKTDNASPEYYMYWMQAALLLLDLYLGQANRTTIPNLSGARLKSFVVPVPPVVEQKKIAYILSTVQTAIEKTEAVIQATRELKRSLMKHLFTYGPTNVGEAENVPLKETEVGLVPEEWDIVRLRDVGTIVMGQSPPGSTYNDKGSGAPFLQGKAEFCATSPKHVKYTTKPLKTAPKGSVLMSVRAPVGDVNIADIDYCIGRGLASLSLDEGDNAFLFYVLSYRKSDIEKEGTGSTFKAINKSKLEEFEIAFPSYTAQRKIAETILSVDQKAQVEENKKQALEALFKTLLSRLMTGKIRVKNLEVPV